MSRSFTVICILLFGIAVLFTYRANHRVHLLEKDIKDTLADTAALREQSRALQAEWTLRDNPERLRPFADQYLQLKQMATSQLTTLAELDSHLPAPRAMPPATSDETTDEPADTPVANAAPPATPPAREIATAEPVPAPAVSSPAGQTEPAPTAATTTAPPAATPDHTVAANEDLPIPPIPVPAPPPSMAVSTTSAVPHAAPARVQPESAVRGP